MPKLRYRTKEARELAGQVLAQGGGVQLTSNGHLKVTGPDGMTIVGSALGDPRAHDNARSRLRAIGITIRRTG